MQNLFDVIPVGFFNYLASNSNHRIYADCLQVIYDEYDREISYRIPRSRIRDALAIYLMENHVQLEGENLLENRNYNEMASAVIRKLSDQDVGWLEEEADDMTYEKHIVMTEAGIRLAEFLAELKKPEKEEFSSYIYTIYNTLQNEEMWKNDPYIDVLIQVNRNARMLSKALKRLATFIRKIIERMVNEGTFESLTENIIEYCEGSFIKEYTRLTKQQNIHVYRGIIRKQLDRLQSEPEIFELLVIGCVVEEEISEQEAEEKVITLIQSTKRFPTDDYDWIMKDIKHKINIYLHVAVGRMRFIYNHGIDIRGNSSGSEKRQSRTPEPFSRYFGYIGFDVVLDRNPGYVRTGKSQMLKGRISDPRNKALMKMFNMIGIGERAGSGVPDIFSVWEQEGWKAPEIEEQYGPDRMILTLSFEKKQAKKTSEKNKQIKTSELKQAKKTIQIEKLSDIETGLYLDGSAYVYELLKREKKNKCKMM